MGDLPTPDPTPLSRRLFFTSVWLALGMTLSGIARNAKFRGTREMAMFALGSLSLVLAIITMTRALSLISLVLSGRVSFDSRIGSRLRARVRTYLILYAGTCSGLLASGFFFVRHAL